MNILFRKWLSACVAMMAISLGILSCEKEPDTKDTVFGINEETVEVPALGGTAKVTYSLENPVEGLQVEVSEDCEWISGFDTSVANEISFSVAANEDPASRDAAVEVVYGDKKDSFTVRQKGAGEKMFTIEASDLTSSTFTAKVTPKDKEMTYLLNYTEKAFYDTYEGDMEKFIEKDLEWYEFIGGQQGLTLEQTLAKLVVKGDVEKKMKGMLPEVEYVCFVYGITTDAKVTSELEYIPVKTLPVDKVDMTFDVKVDVKKGEFKIDINPSDNGQGYFFDYYVKSDLDKAEATVAQAAQAYILRELDAAEVNGETREHRLQELLDIGPAGFNYEGVTGGLECIAFAVAVNEEGFLCSEVSTKDFKTVDVVMSDNEITISSSEQTAASITADFKTTNEDPYVVMCYESSHWSGKTDEEILETLTSGSFSLENVLKGDASFQFNFLNPETAYTVFAFGYDFGVTTGLFKAEFKTVKASDPADLKFTFSYSDVTSSSFKMNVTPDPLDATYFYDIVPAEFTAEDVKTAIEDLYNEQLNNQEVKDKAEFFSNLATMGAVSQEYVGLNPDTEYIGFAVGVYIEKGEYATEIILAEESVRTEAGAGSDCTVNVTWDKYFDAKALSEVTTGVVGDQYLDGNYAMLPATLEMVTNGKMLLYGVMMAEDTGKELSDSEIIDLISSKLAPNANKHYNFFMEYDKEYWIYSVAKEFINSVYTPVFKQKVKLTRDGVSPVSEYGK